MQGIWARARAGGGSCLEAHPNSKMISFTLYLVRKSISEKGNVAIMRPTQVDEYGCVLEFSSPLIFANSLPRAERRAERALEVWVPLRW